MGGLTLSSEGAMTDNKSPLTTPPPQQKPNRLAQSARPDNTEEEGNEDFGGKNTEPEPLPSKTMAAEDLLNQKNLAPTDLKADASKSNIEIEEENGDSKQKSVSSASDEELIKELEKRETQKFEEAKESLMQAIEKNPALKSLSENIKIDITQEGLRIQIIDKDRESMFPSGSAKMYKKTEDLLRQVAVITRQMPNRLSIRGHTDAHPFKGRGGYSNWELSSDRANATRAVLMNNGLPVDRIQDVSGRADTDPFITKDVFNAQNRRISIILLRQDKEKILEKEKRKAAALETNKTNNPVQKTQKKPAQNDSIPINGRHCCSNIAFPPPPSCRALTRHLVLIGGRYRITVQYDDSCSEHPNQIYLVRLYLAGFFYSLILL
jgi:chemotaxis protein MotB